jgi:hypothetical protein
MDFIDVERPELGGTIKILVEGAIPARIRTRRFRSCSTT